MTTNYYIPLKVENLAFYLSSACFAPANFYEQRSRDVQSLCKNSFILMSTKQLVDDSDCSVEICLLDSECKGCKFHHLSEDCFEYHGFLPLSRLVRVHFATQSLLDHMVAEIDLNTAFLPKQICFVGNLTRSKFQMSRSNESMQDKELYEQYIKYERLLGGTALMRLVKDDPYTFSRGYLPFIATKNSYIKSVMDAAGADTNVKEFPGESEWYDKIRQIESNREERGILYNSAINEYAKKYRIHVVENCSMHTTKTDNLSGAALVFAYLKDYKVDDGDTGARLNIDALIGNGFADVKSAEDVAFFFGYSRGYYRFTKQYESVFYKFDSDSWLDMYVIETIYQITLDKTKKYDKFPYIDSQYQSCKKNNLKGGEFLLLDQYVICKKKAAVGSDEWFDGFFQKSVGKIDEILKTLGEYVAPKILEDATKWIRREMRDMLRPLIQDALNEKDKEMQQLIANVKQTYAMQLKEADRDLYDEIDTNHDGILDPDEVHIFIKRLTSVHNSIKQMPDQKQDIVAPEQTLPQEGKKKGGSKKGKNEQTEMSF